MRENLQHEKIAFLSNAERELATYLPTGPTGPILAQFELAAGSVVPGFTVTGINTDLPGKVVGRVSSDVFDSATGRHVLIPQGSVAVGDYSSLVSNGQNRVLIAWEMLTFPDGRSIDLRRQPGVDAEGFAGLKDQVDYHWKELFLAGGLSTAVAVGGQLAEGDDSGFGQTEDVGEQLRELVFGGASDTTSRIANKIIDRQLDVQPTITVRPGWRFNILLTRNLVLEPYVDSRR
ncbi:MAG: TrbI/VirB10 family protein [Planctomycetota bacterium]